MKNHTKFEQRWIIMQIQTQIEISIHIHITQRIRVDTIVF